MRRPLDYGRSTTFTVSLKGITETEAAGIHKVCTINRLSRLRRRHPRILGSKLKRFRDELFYTNADSRFKTNLEKHSMLASLLRSGVRGSSYEDTQPISRLSLNSAKRASDSRRFFARYSKATGRARGVPERPALLFALKLLASAAFAVSDHTAVIPMRSTLKEGDACPKCGTRLRSILCGRCYGTGKVNGRACKNCAGTGTTVGCPNFRSHRLWPWRTKAAAPPAAE